MAISEGQNRELRRFFAHFKAEVVDLKRVSFAEIELNNLPEGKVRFLTRSEYSALAKFLKEEQKEQAKETKKPRPPKESQKAPAKKENAPKKEFKKDFNKDGKKDFKKDFSKEPHKGAKKPAFKERKRG